MAHRSPLLRRFLPAAILLALAGVASAQTRPGPAATAPGPRRAGPAAVEGLPIIRVEIVSATNTPLRTPTQLILDQIRSQAGLPYSGTLVDVDSKSIAALDRFVTVQAEFQAVEDENAPAPRPLRGVILRFIVEERALVASVQIAGNRKFTEVEIRPGLTSRQGAAIDQFRIETDRRFILDLYKKAGYSQTSVDIDRDLLAKQGVLRYQIIEGPITRVTSIELVGNVALSDLALKGDGFLQEGVIKVFPKGLFHGGMLDEDEIQADAARIRDAYLRRGYLDTRVSYVLDYSQDKSAVTLRFVILEGMRYQIGKVTVRGNSVFPEAELLGDTTRIGPGAFAEREHLETLQRRIEDAYSHEGYIYRQVEIAESFTETPGVVDVSINITEGSPFTVGAIIIRGNSTTQDRVIRRQIRIYPDQTFDLVLVRKSIERLKASGIFQDVKITPIVPQDNAPATRDTLVEVAEGTTGRWGFGAGISTNAGVIGQLSLEQTNFDIANLPQSFDEFVRGQSFKGAGQYFQILLEPGFQYQRYRLKFVEPYFADTPYSFSNDLYYFNRAFESWDVQRLGDTVTLGRRFGDVWSTSLALRAEQVTLGQMADLFDDGLTQVNFPSADASGNILFHNDTAQEILDERGSHFLSSAKIAVSRDTTDSYTFPTTGSRASLSLEQYGVLGGDTGITKLEAGFDWYATLYTDLFDHKTVFVLRNDFGYILGGHSPTYERFYLGGMGTLRGFHYRGVGPHSGPRKDPIGGDFSWNTTAEINYPIYEGDVRIRGVVFVDVGTLESDIGFTKIRSDAGAGIRFTLPILGGIPVAIDFAYPISKQPGDRTQYISFALGVPF